MDPVPFVLPGSIVTYSAKAALFTAGVSDRGTFFDNTGTYSISLDAAATLGASWFCYIRNVSGTQTIDPNGAELINGAATYALSNPGDVVLVECTGTAFVVSHAQLPSAVKLTGGSINGIPIGTGVAASAAVTTLTASDTTDATAIGTASVVLQGGLGVAKRICLDGGTGKTLRVTNVTVNSGVAVTLGSTGPTGATAGAPQGWMRLDVNGTDRYFPFW